MRTSTPVAVMAWLLSLAGCDSSTAPPADVRLPDAVVVRDGRAERRTEARASADQARERTPDATPDHAPVDAPQPVGPYTTARGLIHMHSVYSHDACDGKGLVNGQPNALCLKQLRDAVCARKIHFMMLTDHPEFMSSHTMTEDLLYDGPAGDQLVVQSGGPVANRLHCTSGQQVLVSVGFESGHLMPLGLDAKPATPDLYTGTSDSTPAATAQQQIQSLKGLGAVVSVVHSEGDDISPASIVAGGYDAMEWYNIHANISTLLSKDVLSFDLQNIPQLATLVGKLIQLNDFLGTGAAAPHPDLVYLILLDAMPPQGFAKWREVQKTHRITGILGSDIHQNVTVDASVCAGALQIVCSAVFSLVETTTGVAIPPAVRNLLLSGGNIVLNDGDRIDSYLRLMRWLENRVLVKSIDPSEIEDAVRRGRLFGVLTVFGDPHLFSFTAARMGTVLQMGETATGPVTLNVTVPDLPVFLGGAPFSASDALKAEVHLKLLRTDAAGTTVIHETTTLGAKTSKQVSEPGAYHAELWIRPRHLEAALGTASALAGKEYLWVITNPIVVSAP